MAVLGSVSPGPEYKGGSYTHRGVEREPLLLLDRKLVFQLQRGVHQLGPPVLATDREVVLDSRQVIPKVEKDGVEGQGGGKGGWTWMNGVTRGIEAGN